MKPGIQLQNKWSEIPIDTDILLTHGPPYCHGDKVSGKTAKNIFKRNIGDKDLMNVILNDIKPMYHIYGHIHEGYGITKEKGLNTAFINASTCNSIYNCINKPILIYIKKRVSILLYGYIRQIISNDNVSINVYSLIKYYYNQL